MRDYQSSKHTPCACYFAGQSNVIGCRLVVKSEVKTFRTLIVLTMNRLLARIRKDQR
jgi:hypothetical protein